jgi:protein-export membrane protein SecD
MAVDANVLINERVREELRNGKKLIQSLDEGYKFAWATILDSHVTGLVSAIIMFMLGVGPIRGFAVTLMLGVAGSLFTSVFLTRMMVAIWVKRKRPQTLTLGLSGA